MWWSDASSARVVGGLMVVVMCLATMPSTAATDHDDDIVIAVLDSGIRATHETFSPDQVVAWRDFVNGRADPYDDLGHGTFVASAAAGLGSGQTESLAPGAKLAVAKVLSEDDFAFWSDLEAAIYWAVDTAGADVISISIYAYGPDRHPGTDTWGHRLYDALAYARAQGVLPVVLAGNGALNAGFPTMSYFHTPAASQDALIVGGASGTFHLPKGPLGSMEPEVTADYTQLLAARYCDTCYTYASGTSFATPRVAGLAAHLLQVAEAEGIALTVDRLEALIKRSAQDTAAPPTTEGYGFVDAETKATAEAHLRAGTVPDGPQVTVNALYVENVQDTARDLWRDGI